MSPLLAFMPGGVLMLGQEIAVLLVMDVDSVHFQAAA